MLKRVVFLDIDGVLNYHGWRDKPLAGPGSAWFRDKLRNLHPDLVVRLNRIDAKFVLSSSWRYLVRDDVGVMQQMLNARGFERELIGRTALWHEQRKGGDQRGYQIAEWLEDWPTERFVILDDQDDMLHLTPRLVRTDGEVGITDADVDKVMEMLR